MSLRDILVHVDGGDGAAARVETAARLAVSQGARLTGLHVRRRFDMPVLAQSFAGPELDEALARASDEAAADVKAVFDEYVPAIGPECRWLETTGDLTEELINRGRYADLVVVGLSGDDEPHHRRLSSQVILGAGVPALVVPERLSASTIGERVLIAWNASPEAVRAVRFALPILRKAKMVEVVIVAAVMPDAESAPQVGRELLDFLGCHGVTATITLLRMEGVHGVPGAVLARADETGADLIIMGSFGRSWLRETVVGSATGSLLSRSTVPLFVSH